MDGRADNTPEAARTILSKNARSSVPRDFARPTMKNTRRRADNQPGAVRTSVCSDEAASCPEPAESSEKKPIPSPDPAPDAQAEAAATAERAATNAKMGGVNNMTVVGWVVGEWWKKVQNIPRSS